MTLRLHTWDTDTLLEVLLCTNGYGTILLITKSPAKINSKYGLFWQTRPTDSQTHARAPVQHT